MSTPSLRSQEEVVLLTNSQGVAGAWHAVGSSVQSPHSPPACLAIAERRPLQSTTAVTHAHTGENVHADISVEYYMYMYIHYIQNLVTSINRLASYLLRYLWLVRNGVKSRSFICPLCTGLPPSSGSCFSWSRSWMGPVLRR